MDFKLLKQMVRKKIPDERRKSTLYVLYSFFNADYLLLNDSEKFV